MSDDKAYAATPFDELERQIMDVNFAKNEREWWAWREICELRAENEKLRHMLDAETDQARNDVVYFDELRAENAKLRAALKPFKEELEAQIEEVPHITDCNEIFHNYGLRLRHLHAATAAIGEAK